MNFFDRLGSLVPRQPADSDVLEADRELAELRSRQQVLGRHAVVQESVARAVREEMAKVGKAKSLAANLDRYDGMVHVAPQAMGDAHPGTRGGIVTYDLLERVSRVPYVAAVVETRLTQFSEFCRRQRRRGDTGFRVEMRDARQAPGTAALRRIAEIEAWLETCGDPTVQVDPTFESVMTRVMRDSLRYDQACAEVLLAADGRPAALVPVDAKTVRLAQPSTREVEQSRRRLDKQWYVQVLKDGHVHAQWDSDRFLFGVRRPRSDMRVAGYGYPELEQVMDVVTNLLNAVTYNAANFHNGVHATGVLAAVMAADERQFAQFDARLRQTLSGAHNAHRIALVQLDPETKEDVKFIPFNTNNRDMEYTLWMSFLLKVFCATYQMDPSEVNFIYGNEGQHSALGQQDPSDRVALSKERGLRPLLRAAEGWLNRSVVWRLDEDFSMTFTGMDVRPPLVQAALDVQALQYQSTNEVRARQDLPPLQGWQYDVSLNQVAMQAVLADRQADRQARAQQGQTAAQAGQPAPQPVEPPAPGPVDLQTLSDELPAFVLQDATAGDDPGTVDFDALLREQEHERRRSALPAGVTHADLLKAAGLPHGKVGRRLEAQGEA